MWSIHITEYYSALKRNEALTGATTGVNSENTPRERSQAQHDAHCVTLLTWNIQERKRHGDRTQGLRRGVGSDC